MSTPLDGIRVIDCSTVLAGPLAAQLLGDFGADVIKVEHPMWGDPLRTHGASKDGEGLWWTMVGRGKRSVGLYLGDPDGAAILADLAATSDVLIENFRPGTLERWGIGPDCLHGLNPGLVIARVTGFGQDGPYAGRAGFGTLAEAMSGFAAMTGEPDGPPTLPPFGLADSICGMCTAYAVMLALFHREGRGGTGQVIDVSLLEPIMAALGPAITIFDQLGTIPARLGNRAADNAPRNTYRTADDHWVAISSSTRTVAERTLTLVGHPAVTGQEWFATSAGRAAHADILDAHVAEWIGRHTRDQVLAAFAEVGAAAAPVYSVDQLMADPHVVAREMITTVNHPSLGPVRMQNLPFRLTATPGRIRTPGPSLGQHTDEVLHGELGIPTAQVDDLRARGIVA